jgi:hypothetical protein
VIVERFFGPTDVGYRDVVAELVVRHHVFPSDSPDRWSGLDRDVSGRVDLLTGNSTTIP